VQHDSTLGGSWAFSNTAATVVTSSTLRGLAGPSLDTLYYRLGNSCGVGSASKVVFVEPEPSVSNLIGGDSVVCVGDSIHLTESAFNDSAFTWSTSDPLRASMSSPSPFVLGRAAGLDTAIFSAFNHCGSATAKRPITVNPLPFAGIIIGSDSLCVGTSATFTDTVVGGHWNAGGSGISVNSLGVATALTTGIDTLVYSVTQTCGTARDSFQVTIVKPLTPEIAGNSTVCIGTNDTLYGSPAGGGWADIGGDLTVSTTGIVTGLSAGMDSVAYTVSNVCGSEMAEVALTVFTAWQCDSLDRVASPQPPDEAIAVVPNPNLGVFEVQLVGVTADAVASLTDMFGRNVELAFRVDVAGGRLYCRVPLATPGAYVLSVRMIGAVYVRQVVLLGE
jgi:hypothetical protein